MKPTLISLLILLSTSLFAAPVGPTIPTLSEWGLIILGLFLFIFGVVAVKQRYVSVARDV